MTLDGTGLAPPARGGTLGVDEPGGADEQLDEQARRAYRARLADLDAEIEQARRWRDPARAERALTERDWLIGELTAATGLAGRTRRLRDPAERARKTVTARIRDTLRRIDRAHPDLAEHLRATITTGTSCSYVPDRAIPPPVRSQLPNTADGAALRVEPLAEGALIERAGRPLIPPGGVALDDDAVRDLRDADQR